MIALRRKGQRNANAKEDKKTTCWENEVGKKERSEGEEVKGKRALFVTCCCPLRSLGTWPLPEGGREEEEDCR